MSKEVLLAKKLNISITMLAFLLTACNSRDETVVTQIPAAQPASEPEKKPPQMVPQPKASFDANDRQQTYRWIGEEAIEFRLEYLPAREAIQKNPLNDDLQKEFTANKLPVYKAKFTELIGKEVRWSVKVHSIDQEGVIVEADDHVFTEPYTGSGEPLDALYINLFIENGRVNEEIFMERRKLKLGKQITLEFAKTLGSNEEIIIDGRISKIEFKYGDKEPPGWIEITLDEVQAVPNSAVAK
jgi:hypothetical protein